MIRLLMNRLKTTKILMPLHSGVAFKKLFSINTNVDALGLMFDTIKC